MSAEKREIEGMLDLTTLAVVIMVCVVIMTIKSCASDPLGSKANPIHVEVNEDE